LLQPFHATEASPFTLLGHPLSLSYGAILPSSLTRVHSITLVFSTYLPVSVLVREPDNSLEVFPDSLGLITSPKSDRHHVSGLMLTGFAWSAPYSLARSQPNHDDLPFCVTPSVITKPGCTGILTCYPSPTPFGLSLGLD
jgi:hypothetical protein